MRVSKQAKGSRDERLGLRLIILGVAMVAFVLAAIITLVVTWIATGTPSGSAALKSGAIVGMAYVLAMALIYRVNRA